MPPPDLNIQPQTTFHDIQQSFGDLSPKLGGKHLRLDDDRGLHLHDTGKLSGIGAKAAERRAAKHDAAFESVKAAIDQQLGRPGMGEKILRSVLDPEQFDRKLISVDDLGRIGEQVDKLARRNEQIETILQDLGPKVKNDEGVIHDLRTLLRMNGSIDLTSLARQAKELPDWGIILLDANALRQDLRREDLGLCQVLAKHGLIDTNSTKHRGFMTAWTTSPDLDAFRYENITGKTEEWAKIRGTRIETSYEVKGFSVCSMSGLHDLKDRGELKNTGDKLHICVDPGRVDQAWNVVLPILLRNLDVVQQFKVTDMEYVRQDISTRTKTLEDDWSKLSEARRDELQKGVESGFRVLEGAQITLYPHEDGETGPSLERLKEVVAEITEALQREGIDPGTRPGSDHNVNEYFTFRNDLKEDGRRLETDDPEYPRYKEAMVDRPMYQALTS